MGCCGFNPLYSAFFRTDAHLSLENALSTSSISLRKVVILTLVRSLAHV